MNFYEQSELIQGFSIREKLSFSHFRYPPLPRFDLEELPLDALHSLASPPTHISSPGTQSHSDINLNEISLRRLWKGHMTHSKTENNNKKKSLQ